VTYDETEIVADAGTRLRIIADGMLQIAAVTSASPVGTEKDADCWRNMARHVDEVRVRLCALPIEAEGEAA